MNTGLGLVVCYEIATRHNAKIDIEAGPTGATFYVRFSTPINATITMVSTIYPFSLCYYWILDLLALRTRETIIDIHHDDLLYQRQDSEP